LKQSLTRNALFYIFLAYTLLMVAPVSFQGTMPYLDAAWAYGLNYFLHSPYRFGPDLIFTYGPLGFLDNPQYVSNDIPVAVSVHLVFLLALGWQLARLWRSGRQSPALAFCLALILGHRLYNDYWDYNLLALSLISVARLLRSPAGKLDLVLLPVLAGITFLLKFTTFSILVLMLAVYALHLVLERSLSGRQAFWLGGCLLSGPAAYLIYDRSPSHLGQYVRGAFEIAAGFATALSTQPEAKYLLLAALAILLLLASALPGLRQRRLLFSEFLLLLLVTWTVFRHGFVRGDSWHVIIFFAFFPMIFACLFLSLSPGKLFLPGLSLAAVTAIALTLSGHYPVFVAANWWPRQAFTDIRLLSQPANLVYSLEHGSDAAFDALPGMPFRQSIEGKRVLVFPNSIPYVAKLDFDMFPVYALQGYQAYTAYLDNKGAQNLASAAPPVDKVLFEWDIDGRNPVLNSPALTRTILSRFQLETALPDALLLAQRATPLPLPLSAIGHQPFQPDGWVAIPHRNQLVAMSIQLKQNLIGTLITNLYAQDAIYLELATRSGTVQRFRVPPQTLSTPGIINYVPNSPADFAKLWNPAPLPDQIIKIRLTGPGLRWTDSNGYQFYQIENASITLAP
jgi:hypothetical protein